MMFQTHPHTIEPHRFVNLDDNSTLLKSRIENLVLPP